MKIDTPAKFRKLIAHHVPASGIATSREWMQDFGGRGYKYIRTYLYYQVKRFVYIDYWCGVITVKAEFALEYGRVVTEDEAMYYSLALGYVADVMKAIAKENE